MNLGRADKLEEKGWGGGCQETRPVQLAVRDEFEGQSYIRGDLQDGMIADYHEDKGMFGLPLWFSW